MTDTEAEAEALSRFADDVAANLEKNGYPGRRVAFPIERMYELAHAKELNFNKVLDVLATRGIAHEKTPERIIFSPVVAEMPSPNPMAGLDLGALAGLDFSALAGLDFGALAGLDAHALAGMTPEQAMAAAAELFRSVKPEQLAAIRGMFDKLTDAQKAELLERAKKLGLR